MIKYYIRRIILKLFGINLWHQSAFVQREYAKKIVDILSNDRPLNYLIDIGCGLCEISKRLSAEKKLLIDKDKNIVRYLKLIYFFKNLIGHVEIFSDVEDLSNYSVQEKVVTLILNFSHDIEFQDLKKIINKSINISESFSIYIDTVNNPTYKYNHEQSLKNEYNHFNLIEIGRFENGRKLWSIQPI